MAWRFVLVNIQLGGFKDLFGIFTVEPWGFMIQFHEHFWDVWLNHQRTIMWFFPTCNSGPLCVIPHLFFFTGTSPIFRTAGGYPKMMGLGKGGLRLKIWSCLVSMLDFWGVVCPSIWLGKQFLKPKMPPFMLRCNAQVPAQQKFTKQRRFCCTKRLACRKSRTKVTKFSPLKWMFYIVIIHIF